MSEKEIARIMNIIQKTETVYMYEKENADAMELVSDAYTEYKSTLGYN